MKRNFKRILACTVAALLLFSTAAFAVPLMQFNAVLVEVSTAEELHDALTSGAAGRTIQLANNITATNWIPVAISDTAIGNFTLDGNGHTVTLSAQHNHLAHSGLFGMLDSANITIENLGVVNQGISASGAFEDVHAGGLVGLAQNSIITISGSFVLGAFVEAIRPNEGGNRGRVTAGGLVGFITNNSTLNVINSFAITDISAAIIDRNVLFNELNSYAGGLVGGRNGDDNSQAFITNSYFVGSVLASATGPFTNPIHRHAGGIIGRGPANAFNDSAYVARVTFDGTSPFGRNRNESGVSLTHAQLQDASVNPLNNWQWALSCNCIPCNPSDEPDYVCACGCQDGVWEYREGVNQGFPVLHRFEDAAFLGLDFVSGLFLHDSTEYNHILASWALELSIAAYISPCGQSRSGWMPLFGWGNKDSAYVNLQRNGFVDIEPFPQTIAQTITLMEVNEDGFSERNVEPANGLLGMGNTAYSSSPDFGTNYFDLGVDYGFTTLSESLCSCFLTNFPHDQIVHTIAHREIERADGEQQTVVAVVIRGSGGGLTGPDWRSNFTMGEYEYSHQGFRLAMEEVLRNLSMYMENPSRGINNPIIFITGHSRGASVGNLLAAYLNGHTDWDSDNIFAYTFATARNTSAPEQHENIFNILNRNDLVTSVPPWYSRHGINIPITMNAIAPDITQHMAPYPALMNAQPRATSLERMMYLSENFNRGLLPRLLSLKCPVDITIYDDAGNAVAQIINDEVVLINDTPIFAWVTDDGEKNFFVPHGVELSHAHVISRDHGTMLFAAATVCAAMPEPVEMKLFEDVTLQPGTEFIIPLNDVAIEDIQLLIMEDGEIVGEVATDGSVAVTSISIYNEPDLRVLTIGEQHQLAADFVPALATNRAVIWSSSNADVATISANGLVTAQGAGSAIVSVTSQDGGHAAHMIVTVQPETEITISGAPARILTLGQQIQLMPTVTPNSTALPVVWTSSNETVATVDQNGLVSTHALGNAIITATTQDGSMAQVLMTVEAETVIAIAGEPTRILTLGQQQQLTATVTNNSTSLPISWASSNPEVASVSANGLVSALATGSTIIAATTQDGRSAQVMIAVEVTTEIAILGEPIRILTIGHQHQLIATVSQNSTALPLTWASNNAAVATVSEHGLITAIAIGSAIISVATQDGLAAQIMLTVQPETEISIVGAAIRILNPGQLQQLTATATPNPTAHPIVWASSDETVATVDQSGAITAHALGVSIVSATTQDGISAQIIVTVEPPTVLVITGEPIRTITAGQHLQLAVEVTQNSTALPLTWTSNDTAIATVNQSGRITAHEPGTAVITVTTADGITAQVVVQVEPEPEQPSTWQVIWQWLSNTVAWLGRAFAWIMPIVGFFVGLGWLIWLAG